MNILCGDILIPVGKTTTTDDGVFSLLSLRRARTQKAFQLTALDGDAFVVFWGTEDGSLKNDDDDQVVYVDGAFSFKDGDVPLWSVTLENTGNSFGHPLSKGMYVGLYPTGDFDPASCRVAGIIHDVEFNGDDTAIVSLYVGEDHSATTPVEDDELRFFYPGLQAPVNCGGPGFLLRGDYPHITHRPTWAWYLCCVWDESNPATVTAAATGQFAS